MFMSYFMHTLECYVKMQIMQDRESAVQAYLPLLFLSLFLVHISLRQKKIEKRCEGSTRQSIAQIDPCDK